MKIKKKRKGKKPNWMWCPWMKCYEPPEKKKEEKMGEPYKDDSCAKCGSYNNALVICDECLKEILCNAGISKKKIEEIIRELD